MTSWAIVVGIDTYPAHAGLGDLHGSVADALDFADWALDPAGGNVPPANLYFWSHPWPAPQPGALGAYLAGALPGWDFDFTGLGPPDPTRPPAASEIVETIQRVGREAWSDAQEEDNEDPRRVFVFFAGHGLRAKETGTQEYQTCFVAGNFKPAVGNNAKGVVGCSSLREALLSGRFTEAVLFLDCCRVSANVLTMSVAALCDPLAQPSGAVWGVGQAAQDGYPAYETTTVPVRGAFSKTLMEGLRHYREPVTGELRISDIESYVLKNIGNATPHPQTPYFQPEPRPRGPLLVASAPTAKPGPTVNLSALPGGTQVVLKDGVFAPVPHVAVLIASQTPIALPLLADGLYLLEVVGDPARKATFIQPIDRVVDVR